MKLIDSLNENINSNDLDLIKNLIYFDTFLSVWDLRKLTKRNHRHIKKDIERLFELGILIKEQQASKIGIYKGEVLFTKYKIYPENKLILLLKGEIDGI